MSRRREPPDRNAAAKGHPEAYASGSSCPLRHGLGQGNLFETRLSTMMLKNSNSRRGALLLVILGLLAMFGLVAIALVVLSTQAKRSSTAASLIDQAADPPQRVLDEAMRQVARGSNNPGSVMGPHSLLETMYGNTSFVATVSSASASCSGQLTELALSNSGSRWLGGCVVTVLTSTSSGTASPVGQSAIIVGFNPTSLNPQIPAFENGTRPQGTDTVLINGAPFSGAGLGYTASGGTDANTFLEPGSPLKSYGTADANGVYNPPGVRQQRLYRAGFRTHAAGGPGSGVHNGQRDSEHAHSLDAPPGTDQGQGDGPPVPVAAEYERPPVLHRQQSQFQSHLGRHNSGRGTMGRGQRRRRRSGQRVGRSGLAGAGGERRAAL